MVSIRDEIAELGREQDRLLTEHHQWMARREAASGAPVQKSDEPGILYRVTDNNSLQLAPQPDAEASDADGADWQDIVARANGEIIAHERRRERAEREAAIAPLQERIIKLEAQVEVLTRLFTGANTKNAANVVDLPNWRRDRA
jgi:hypothetical protein